MELVDTSDLKSLSRGVRVRIPPSTPPVFGAMHLIALVFLLVTASTASSADGIASWYSAGAQTANGEAYNPDGLSAAHRYLPFGAMVCVVNTRNKKKVRVRINDRGPFVRGRIIDLSREAGRRLGMIKTGTAKVTVSSCKASR